MRAALSLKPSNANSAINDATSNKVTSNKTNAPLGKLTRQTGMSNLHRENIQVKQPEEPLIKIESKENFEVFEDPVEELKDEEKKEEEEEKPVIETVKETNTNNLIYELERKMEEKRHADEQKKKFMLTRDNSDNMSRCSEPPSEISIFNDDDDFDKLSVASSTFTTTVRASFSTINVNSEVEVVEKKKTVIQKKVERETRDDIMFSSDEYFFDILKYMMHRQTRNRPSPTYFSRQEHVNEEMRMILIDWFNDVVKEYRLQKETFHLAVKLVDRILSYLSVDKAQFQLVGTTALLIAAKYEEIFPPEINEFAIITDNTYDVSEILAMERYLLGKFSFVIALPTAAWFGACFAKRLRFNSRMHKSLNYLLDLSLIHSHYLHYLPSNIAAAAVCFTNLQYDLEGWPTKMIEDTGIKTEEIAVPIERLHHSYITANASDYKSIFNKYCEMDEREVALSSAPTNELQKMFPKIFEVSPKKAE